MYETARLRQLRALAEAEAERMRYVKGLAILLPSERELLIAGAVTRMQAWLDEVIRIRVQIEIGEMQ